jgi:MFS family permease
LIRSLAVIGTFNAIAGGAVAGILVVFADRAFSIHPGNPALGAFYVAASVGSLLGGASLPVLRQRFRVVPVTLMSLVVSTVLMGLLAVTPVFLAAVALYGLWQGVYGLIINNGQTLRMQILPDEYQSRVGTAARMLGWGGAPIGALLAGFVADRVPVRWVLLIAVVALLSGVVLAARARGPLAGLEPAMTATTARKLWPHAPSEATTSGRPVWARPAKPAGPDWSLLCRSCEGSAGVGSRTRNAAPSPGAVTTSTVPSCAATMAATMASPSPVPPVNRARDGSAR